MTPGDPADDDIAGLFWGTRAFRAVPSWYYGTHLVTGEVCDVGIVGRAGVAVGWFTRARWTEHGGDPSMGYLCATCGWKDGESLRTWPGTFAGWLGEVRSWRWWW